MATPDLPDPRRPPTRAGVEMAGLFLAALGTVGLVVCAFQVGQVSGWASVSMTILAIGVALMFER